MMMVKELPIWADCPFRGLIPAEYEVRKGDVAGIGEMISIYSPQHEMHVDTIAPLNVESVVVMVKNLDEAIHRKAA